MSPVLPAVGRQRSRQAAQPVAGANSQINSQKVTRVAPAKRRGRPPGSGKPRVTSVTTGEPVTPVTPITAKRTAKSNSGKGAPIEAQPDNATEKPSVPERGFQRLVRKSDMAQMLGISTRALQDMLDSGCPVVDRGRPGQAAVFDVTQVIAWKAARDRRGENPAMTQSANAAQDARRRNHEAQAAMREFELAAIAGDTIRVSEVLPILRDQLARVRAQLLQVPARIAPDIQADMTIAEIEDVIDREIRDCLGELTLDEVELKRVA
jgi:phage terminase Nu1 subunit (DNA packaging protein)